VEREDGHVHTAEEVRAMQGMYSLVDILVRRRHLLILQASSGTVRAFEAAVEGGMSPSDSAAEWTSSELKKLNVRANDMFGIAELETFHREIDIVCLARKRLERSREAIKHASDGASKVVGSGNDESLLVNARRKVLGAYPLDSMSFVSDKRTSQTIAVHLLANNIHLYENELTSKIDFVMTGDSNVEEKIISEYHSVNRWNGVKDVAYFGTMLAIPVGVLYLVVESMKK
jgi:hypothetical protein